MFNPGSIDEVSISNGCGRHGTIWHELMHSLGFVHEQARTDRDTYVEILWDNIKPGKFNSSELVKVCS